MARRLRLAVALAATVSGAAALAGTPAPDPAADADLFEFLGSVDSVGDSQAAADDGSWLDYLSRTDINKVAKASDPDPAARVRQSAAGRQPIGSGDKKDD
ncbi:MAG: hypothetical protein JOZ12_03285 [Sinobacteraceae bacterium]|nr:hypothetical protein [Nevskiaceae bacterium]MBV8854186.1 hypothetical protein [Nevskiaceae bacterium]MBV9912933.1 hypothetical protein [Nevskiaceae bacterium]